MLHFSETVYQFCFTLLNIQFRSHFYWCPTLTPCQVIDGRPKGRFDGTSPEPNQSLNSGHILGSASAPFMTFINSDTKTLKDKDGVKESMFTVIS